MNHQFPRVQSAGVRGAKEVAQEQLYGPGVRRTDLSSVGVDSITPEMKRADVSGIFDGVPVSPIIDAFDKRALLERTDPLLALAYYVEAVADGRTQGGVDAYSKIAAMQAEVRRMLRQVGAPLERVAVLYPRYSEMKP